MKILAVDTSDNTATACVAEDNKLLAECVVNYKKTHSQTLMPMIDKCLNDSGTDISQIDLFAVANGPGSFTGLRIGVSAVKGMAHALDKPIIEVSTLEGMAYNLYMCADIVCPIMDARRSQVYNAVYSWDNGKLNILTPPRALSVEECVEDVKKYGRRVVFLGGGVDVHREYITEQMGENAVFAPFSCNAQRAAALAAAAMSRIDEKKTCYEVVPFYLRKPQAERELEEKQKERL